MMKKAVILPFLFAIWLIGCSPQTAPLETAAVELETEQTEAEEIIEPTAVPATKTPEPTAMAPALVISDDVLAMGQEELDDALLDAARNDDLVYMQELLAAGADINVQGSTLGFAPITVTVVRGNLDSFTLLYEQGADLTVIDDNDDTLLHHVAFHGEVEMAELILAADVVDLQARRDPYAYTAMLLAVSEGNIEVMELLLAAGADIEVLDSWGDTPINVAAWNGETETVKRLIELGAVVDVANQYGHNALYHATSQGHEETAAVLADAAQN